MTQRTVEDRLREEYFLLAPEIKRVLHQLQTEVVHLLLPATLALKDHERIHVEARAKECDSAINALRRREEAMQFDEDASTRYTLTSLSDLAALRILVFPRPTLEYVHPIVHAKYAEWTADPVKTGTPPKFRAWKYHGFCSTSSRVRAELQIVPMLTGLFWQIEHDAFYKPRDPVLRGAANKPVIRERTERVYAAFDELEDVLERELQRNASETLVE
jgi:ppGpp synthetase/RelA/SpoT-type nucleotidyltranferase